MSTQLIVPIADRLLARATLLQELGVRLGLPVATGGYTGMAARYLNGQLAPPGVGETMQAVEEIVSRDGSEVAFMVEDLDGTAVVLRDQWKILRDKLDPNELAAIAMVPKNEADKTVQGMALPATRTVDDRTYFPGVDIVEVRAGGFDVSVDGVLVDHVDTWLEALELARQSESGRTVWYEDSDGNVDRTETTRAQEPDLRTARARGGPP